MKRSKLIVTILAILSLLLCGWFGYDLSSDNGNLVGSSLNLIYFLTLFVVFLCVRITMSFSGKIEPVVALLSLVIIGSSTYTWVDSAELLVVGKYTLAFLPILIGTTLMYLVKTDSKLSKIVQAGIGIISVSMTVCVFSGAVGASIYTILFIGLLLVSLTTLGFTIFNKTT